MNYDKDPDGIRRKFPDKVTCNMVVTQAELIELAREYVGAPKDGSDITISPGAFVSISWTDWPPEEKALRKTRCPHCYLMWGQEDRWSSNHLIGCPNLGSGSYDD